MENHKIQEVILDKFRGNLKWDKMNSGEQSLLGGTGSLTRNIKNEDTLSFFSSQCSEPEPRQNQEIRNCSVAYVRVPYF